MSNSYPIGRTMEVFETQFPDRSLVHEEVEMDKGLAHSFFIDFADVVDLEKNWRQIVNFIAIHFQNKLENEFECWNIYLFFRVPMAVGKELKYKIENDTFSSRKVIIDNTMNPSSAINVHIMNELTQVGTEMARASTQLDQNPIILKVLKGKTLKKTKITPEAQKAYDKLLENLKKEDEV